MPDMLVKLYELEDDWSFLAKQSARGVTIRKPIGPEKRLIVEWIERNIGLAVESDVTVAPEVAPGVVAEAGLILDRHSPRPGWHACQAIPGSRKAA